MVHANVGGDNLMDWFLMVTTLFTNAGLGWFKGAWWAWLIHAINAIIWIFYSLHLDLMGFVGLSVVTILIDAVSGYKSWTKRRIRLS